MRHRRQHAFTLIELLVVISIIALLIGILLPALAAARTTAVTLQCLTQLRDIGIAVDVYSLDHDGDVPINGNATGGQSFDGKIVRWPNLINPYYGQSDKGNSGDVYGFLHYKCPTQIDIAPPGINPVGTYGINTFFGHAENTSGNFFNRPVQKNWRQKAQIDRPSDLPFFGDTGAEDTAAPGSAGGLSISETGPHGNAEFKYGWSDPVGEVNDRGPSPNHNGATNYLFADGHAETIGEIWPWSDFIGTDFHPKGDITVDP
ncbi:MAG: prepilin-type N-terminal cleavage/methylation domain-containing protein [Planctomycetota bacterium]